MYGLIFAAVQLELPFTLVRSFVVSETASKVREGWAYVDRLRDDQVCQPLSEIDDPLPVTLHYCERYVVLSREKHIERVLTRSVAFFLSVTCSAGYVHWICLPQISAICRKLTQLPFLSPGM
jgi:hypothetical protein